VGKGSEHRLAVKIAAFARDVGQESTSFLENQKAQGRSRTERIEILQIQQVTGLCIRPLDAQFLRLNL
jgi:hypothetical protein